MSDDTFKFLWGFLRAEENSDGYKLSIYYNLSCPEATVFLSRDGEYVYKGNLNMFRDYYGDLEKMLANRERFFDMLVHVNSYRIEFQKIEKIVS